MDGRNITIYATYQHADQKLKKPLADSRKRQHGGQPTENRYKEQGERGESVQQASIPFMICN